MTSAEKLHALLAEASAQKPTTAEEASLYGILRMVAPLAGRFIPSEPERLDELLLGAARMCLGLRSDDAPPANVGEWIVDEPDAVLEALGVSELVDEDLNGEMTS